MSTNKKKQKKQGSSKSLTNSSSSSSQLLEPPPGEMPSAPTIEITAAAADPFSDKHVEQHKATYQRHSKTITTATPTTPSSTTSSALERVKYKIAVIGPTASGKTAVCRSILNQPFEASHEETIEETYETIVSIPPPRARGVELLSSVTLYDTGGSEDYWILLGDYLSKCDGVLLVYDASNSTPEDLELYFERLVGSRQGKGTLEFKPLLILANKQDLVDSEEEEDEDEHLTATEISFATKQDVPLFEASAFESKNVVEAVQELLSIIHYGGGRSPGKKSPRSSKRSTTTSHQPLKIQEEDYDAPPSLSITSPQCKTSKTAYQLTTQELDALQDTLFKKHDTDYLLLVLYNGAWCTNCEHFVKELSSHVEEFRAMNASICLITSESQRKANFAKMAWDLSFDIYSDPTSFIAKKHGVYFAASKSNPLLSKLAGFAKAFSKSTPEKTDDLSEQLPEVSHPAIVMMHRDKGEVYKWMHQPKEGKLCGKITSPEMLQVLYYHSKVVIYEQ